jgi:hypothetical protein
MDEEEDPMTSWTDDDGLMDQLADALAQESGVPPHRRRAAYGAFAWRTVEEDLLDLVHDSALQTTAAVRGAEDARTLAFAGGGLSLELEVDDSTLTGQLLSSGGGGEVTLERADGESRTARTDASGFVTLPGASGPTRFAVEIDGTVHRTEWLVL